MNTLGNNMDPRKRRIILLVGVVAALLICFLVVSLLVSKNSGGGKHITQTGGNYSPDKTSVVFYNADSLYAQLRNEDTENLRSELKTYAEQKYGQGQYHVKVVDDKVNYLPTEEGIPPSFWFSVTFDGHADTLRVNVDLSSGVAVFNLQPGV